MGIAGLRLLPPDGRARRRRAGRRARVYAPGEGAKWAGGSAGIRGLGGGEIGGRVAWMYFPEGRAAQTNVAVPIRPFHLQDGVAGNPGKERPFRVW